MVLCQENQHQLKQMLQKLIEQDFFAELNACSPAIKSALNLDSLTIKLIDGSQNTINSFNQLKGSHKMVCTNGLYESVDTFIFGAQISIKSFPGAEFDNEANEEFRIRFVRTPNSVSPQIENKHCITPGGLSDYTLTNYLSYSTAEYTGNSDRRVLSLFVGKQYKLCIKTA